MLITAAIEDNILYEPALFGKPEQQLFEPHYWLSRNAATFVSGGRGQVVFIRGSQRNWVLRHYRRGGLVAKFNADRYLWQGVEATRCFREWRLLAKLVELELPVPVPVAARYVRGIVSYRADLITQEIPGARSLAACLANAALAAEQWQLLGTTLARFHANGVKHADLNAHNIVFDQARSIHVLDFDRGTIRTPEQKWIDGVLERLLRSLNKLRIQRQIHFSNHDWQQLSQAHNEQLKRLML